jgi:hypothetical protein
MANCLAPGFIRLFYTSNSHPHVQVIPVSPSGSGGSIQLTQKNGSLVDWDTAMISYVALARAIFHTADTFDSAEIFTQADCDSAPVFQDNMTFSGINGTQTPADVPWSQDVMTFRTVGGGRAKLQFMETVYAVDLHVPIPGGSGSETDAIAAFATGSTSFITGRDNTYLAAPLNQTTKTNDQLRKKFLDL